MGVFATPRSDAISRNQPNLTNKTNSMGVDFSAFASGGTMLSHSKFNPAPKPTNREELVKFKVSQYFDQQPVF